ncbi:hypothetical protein Pcinc_017512 [Petrolisthes cinctipes]|uniref:Uncharacterized protein n=1 Tax=Petrolisthes cinctipes TaxID=88211 RepID=A0AAE1KMR1_PETCI|nr:hypothetical protein Pcinc_017512 [Petrolisthes cinctipes]
MRIGKREGHRMEMRVIRTVEEQRGVSFVSPRGAETPCDQTTHPPAVATHTTTCRCLPPMEVYVPPRSVTTTKGSPSLLVTVWYLLTHPPIHLLPPATHLIT